MKVFLVPGGEKWAMKLFFVGVNLGSQQEYMRIYLAGVNPYKEETMRLFLAQASRDKRLNNEVGRIPCCVLESFFYIDKYTERLIPLCKDFMLDSGAFTFMEGGGGKIDWNDYVCRYADFVKRNNISKYLELDIDSVVGLPRVLELRRLLEKQVGRPCIPVWHRSRGMDNFRKMCDEYNYVAVGGIVSGEIKGDDYRVFPYLIQEAHKRNARIHGLGFTNLNLLAQYHFDNVDSTAWLSGNRFGTHYIFNGHGLSVIRQPKNTRLADQKKTCLHNFLEWVKFANYAETHY